MKGQRRTTTTRKKSRNHHKARGGKLLAFFHKLPWWGWCGAGLIVISLYVFVMYVFFVDPSSRSWKALYGDATFPEGYDVVGVDISHYQGRIDWVKLRNATINDNPLRFIIIKATEGKSIFDDSFNDNFYQARENGFVRGAYHFYSSDVSAEEQADWFLRQVHLEEGDLPPVFDVETKSAKISDEMFRKEILTWLTRVGSHYGVKPILYTSYKFKLRYLNDSVFDTYPYWIAHYYVDSLRYTGSWKFWQHTDCGKVSGIKGHVDLDVYNGSEYDLQQLTIPARRKYDE